MSRGVLILCGLGALLLVLLFREGRLGWSHLWLFLFAVPSIVLHEVSHGWMAHVYGDPTPRNSGRLGFGLRKHVDVIGTLVIPGMLVVIGFSPFGYAKPMPVNAMRLTPNRKMIVGLAGVAMNLMLAIVATLLLYALSGVLPPWLLRAIVIFGMVNVALTLFYLIPLPPLDGAAVVERYLPHRYWSKYLTFKRYSVFVILGLFILGLEFWAGIQAFFLGLWGMLLP